MHTLFQMITLVLKVHCVWYYYNNFSLVVVHTSNPNSWDQEFKASLSFIESSKLPGYLMLSQEEGWWRKHWTALYSVCPFLLLAAWFMKCVHC